ncbi:hypothetical protein PSI23_22610, partial [Xenorhabdus sp. XENO-10]
QFDTARRASHWPAVLVGQFQADNRLGFAVGHHRFIGRFKARAGRADGGSSDLYLSFHPLRGIALIIIGDTGQGV